MIEGSTPPSPPLERDRLYMKLAKGSGRATQFVPSYDQFRLGHGDPLLKATMKHDLEMASPKTKRKMLQSLDAPCQPVLVNRDPNLTRLGFSDIVHLPNGEVLSVPIIPVTSLEERKPDQLQEYGPALSGLGMSDIIHLPNNKVVSIPCLPIIQSS